MCALRGLKRVALAAAPQAGISSLTAPARRNAGDQGARRRLIRRALGSAGAITDALAWQIAARRAAPRLRAQPALTVRSL